MTVVQPASFRSAKVEAPANLAEPEARFFVETAKAYRLDGPALRILAAACESLQIARECNEAIRKQGRTFARAGKAPQLNPLCQVERDARSKFLVALRALNLDLSGSK
jgi:hypothetical protein